jgi:two-component system OmpR family sensor kinase
MIRTRLALAFALLALLALLQFGFAGWAASSAAHHAERSVVATRMLAEYLDLSGNKQRLKVWYAQKMLGNEADPAVREQLTAAMRASVKSLRTLAARMPSDAGGFEANDLDTIALNIATLDGALREATYPGRAEPAGPAWRAVMRAFDESAGRDMRALLREAVARQQDASRRESRLLAEAIARIRTGNALLGAAVFLIAAIAVAYFVRRLGQPFARLAQLSQALAGGDFQARSGLAGNDEFARIGGLLDSMAARLAEAQARSSALQGRLDELVAERTRALTQAYEALLGIESRRRQFFAEIGHELRTPVTVIRGEADLALRNAADPDDQRATLRRIADAARDLGGRVQDLLDAARGGSLEYAVTLRQEALPAIVAAAVAQMQAVAAHRGVVLAFDPAGSSLRAPVVDVDRERLQQALVVVLDNAIRYSSTGGRVQVGITSEPDLWLVHIDDEGPGMSDDELDHAFEFRFRGRAGRERDPHGLGIGLAIARRIVEAQRGSIDLLPREPRGMRAVIALPAVEPIIDAPGVAESAT